MLFMSVNSVIQLRSQIASFEAIQPTLKLAIDLEVGWFMNWAITYLFNKSYCSNVMEVLLKRKMSYYFTLRIKQLFK